MQAVVIAGGLGTRLRPLTLDVPKPMIPVNGKPFLEYKLDELKKGGVHEVILCVGYMADKIVRHFGDGSSWGIKIRYSHDGNKLLGVIGALKRAEEMLDDAFIMTYGDNYLAVDYSKMIDRLISSGMLGVMAVYHNKGRYGKSDADVKDGLVVKYSKSMQGLGWINYGALAFRKKALAFVPKDTFYGEEEFHSRLIEMKEMGAFVVRRRFYDIGSPYSLKEFEEYISKL